jgi:hypothetical protein
MKSSLHSLIHFFPFLLNHLQLPSPELDPILSNSLKRPSVSLYNPSAWATQKTASLLLRRESLFTDLLPSNGCPIVAYVHFHGNVFTESLPSNEYVLHNIKYIQQQNNMTACSCLRKRPIWHGVYTCFNLCQECYELLHWLLTSLFPEHKIALLMQMCRINISLIIDAMPIFSF